MALYGGKDPEYAQLMRKQRRFRGKWVGTNYPWKPHEKVFTYTSEVAGFARHL